MLLRVRAAGKVGTVYFLKQTWVANEWEGVKDNTTDDQCWKGQSEGRVTVGRTESHVLHARHGRHKTHAIIFAKHGSSDLQGVIDMMSN